MPVSTPIPLEKAQKIYDALQKSAMLRKKTSQEIQASFAMVQAWKKSPDLKSSSLPQLASLLSLASLWNKSPVFSNMADSKERSMIQMLQKLHANPLLKGKSAQDMEGVAKIVQKWEKEAKKGAQPSTTVRNALKLAQEWHIFRQRQHITDAPGLLRVMSEWDKVRKGTNWRVEDIQPALDAHKAWNKSQDLKGKSVQELGKAYAAFTEWNKNVILQKYTPDILDNPTLRAMLVSGQNIQKPEKGVALEIMINHGIIGHTSLKLGTGTSAILYDPSGSYNGCQYRVCQNTDGSPIIPGLGDTYYSEYNEFDWNDYLAYHIEDTGNVTGYQFIIPKTQAKRIAELIEEYGGRGTAECARTISRVLQESGGVFSELSISRHPISLGADLQKLSGAKIIRY